MDKDIDIDIDIDIGINHVPGRGQRSVHRGSNVRSYAYMCMCIQI